MISSASRSLGMGGQVPGQLQAAQIAGREFSGHGALIHFEPHKLQPPQGFGPRVLLRKK